MGVGSRQRFGSDARRAGTDAVSHAYGTSGSVVVPGAQSAGSYTDGYVDDEPFEETELGEIERGVFLVDADKTDEMVDDVGHSDSGERGATGIEQQAYLRRGPLTPQVGDDRVSVQDSQRRVSCVASSRRARRRASSLVGPRPRYFPSSSSTG